MADNTLIEWTDATWNPITGCSVVSPGCTNCYAMRLAGTRLKHHPSRQGLTIDTKAGPVWNGQVRFNEDMLVQPLRWQRGRKIFVCAHGDLFAEGVPDAWIDKVWAIMALSPQHTYQVLTKRPDRMRDYLEGLRSAPHADERMTVAVNAALLGSGLTWGQCHSTSSSITTLSRGAGAREPNMLRKLTDGTVQRLVAWSADETWITVGDEYADRVRDRIPGGEFGWGLKQWPLPNVWLGISAEDQKRLDQRINDLRWCRAAVRFVSAEPLLGALDFTRTNNVSTVALDALRGIRVDPASGWPLPGDDPVGKIDWVIVGGESGKGSRPANADWVRSIRDQCELAGTALFFKQWGDWVDEQQAPPRTEWEDTTLVHYFEPDADPVWRVGKKWAGRLLDGVEHNAMPAVLS